MLFIDQVPKLADYGMKHTHLLGQGSHMGYEEMLLGMFLENEKLVPVRPLMITNYRMCNAEKIGWPVDQEKFGLRLFLTNKRIFFIEAEIERISRLSRSKESRGDLLLVDRLMVFRPSLLHIAPPFRVYLQVSLQLLPAWVLWSSCLCGMLCR